jgi:hypothetical protein
VLALVLQADAIGVLVGGGGIVLLEAPFLLYIFKFISMLINYVL